MNAPAKHIIFAIAVVLVGGQVTVAKPKTDWLKPVRHLAATVNDFFNSTATQSVVVQPPAPNARPEPKPEFAIFGATGTPIVSGFVNDLQEYNAELRGRAALTVYEKMRRSDADVAAILAACKLPIRSAEFKILPGIEENEPGYKDAQEEAKFIENCLFGDLEYENALGVKFSQRFESVIENALLCLDFGCSGHEDIWVVDGDRIRLARIAPRLPLTFYRFHIEPDGETLRAVEQWGYRGDQWINVPVPASKFTLFTYRQEGANFYGRSMLREAYQHWYTKQALYRIDAIACERNGVGVPVIEQGENPDVTDQQKSLQWAADLAANESTSLSLPYGWSAKIMGVEGREHNVLPSIQHHSEMICRSALAMFMTLGSSKTGSRALGATMFDFFQLAEEATGRFICDTISETTIRRLCDFNFPDRKENRNKGDKGGIPYPRLSIPNIAAYDPIALFTSLKDIADSKVDLLQPDDETENWIRKKAGMPLKAEKARPREGAAVAAAMNPNEPAPEPKDMPAKPKPGAKPTSTDKTKQGKSRLNLRELEGRRTWHDLNISIENEVGSTRSGVGKDGQPWEVTMQHPYGYIRRTEGVDGDHVDCFVGPDKTAKFVYVIHQHEPTTGEYDEDKCMLDFPSADAAKAAYLANYNTPAFFHSMTVLPVAEFIEKVKTTYEEPQKITAVELTRDLEPHEKKHDFAGHARRQDSTQVAVRRLLASATPPAMREAARRTASLSPEHLDTAAMPFDRYLNARIRKSTGIAYRYGYDQVYRERKKATKRGDLKRTLAESAEQDQPNLIAEAAVADFTNWLMSRAKGAHIDAYKLGLREQALEDAILKNLQGGSTAVLDRIATEASRSAVAGGRWAAFQELAGEIAKYVRSEAMDQNTCETCAAGDGKSWDSLDEVDWSPGDDCDGKDACRGQLMPVFADEGTVELV